MLTASVYVRFSRCVYLCLSLLLAILFKNCYFYWYICYMQGYINMKRQPTSSTLSSDSSNITIVYTYSCIIVLLLSHCIGQRDPELRHLNVHHLLVLFLVLILMIH